MLLLDGAVVRNGNTVVLLQLTKVAVVSVLLQVTAELDILALELTIHVGNKEPGDNGTSHGKSGTNEENALDTLGLVVERILNGGEDLSTDCGTSLADSGGQAKEVATDRGREGLGTTQESSNLAKWISEILPLRKHF